MARELKFFNNRNIRYFQVIVACFYCGFLLFQLALRLTRQGLAAHPFAIDNLPAFAIGTLLALVILSLGIRVMRKAMGVSGLRRLDNTIHGLLTRLQNQTLNLLR